MDINALWIGDRLRIKASKEIVSYEGQDAGGKLKVKYKEQLLLLDATELELVGEEKQKPDYDLSEALSKANHLEKALNTETEIDLHIDILAPHMLQALPERIRDYQVERCAGFLEAAVKAGHKIVKIIHGKGKGVLKAEIIHLLKHTNAVKFYIAKNDGGALEVWLR